MIQVRFYVNEKKVYEGRMGAIPRVGEFTFFAGGRHVVEKVHWNIAPGPVSVSIHTKKA